MLKSAAGLQSATLADRDTGRPICRLTPTQLDTLKGFLAASFISESLLFTPPPWDVCLELETARGESFVALYYGDVLRINMRAPRSTLIADSGGTVPAPGIADIVLNGEGSSWLFETVHAMMGTPPSKSHLGPGDLPSRRKHE